MTQSEKNLLRAQIKILLSLKKKCDYEEAGLKAAEIFSSWFLQNGRSKIKKVALFHSMSDEIEIKFIANLLKNAGCSLFFPSPSWKNAPQLLWIEEHSQNYIESPRLDLIIVPGRAFDKHGRRLGRGQGCYDRCLAPLLFSPKSPILMGVALKEQIVEAVPTQAHDIKMDFILTPENVLKA
ncbi:MAG: 5-formyltetrahydrofolate cyclo-ligase [Myxococcales bacterium]|nr:5-formyltetrahydrofolate cyclo-ligase [Myxococcales bacterium]USN50999.1 MAG: 5-formyltetrahydrofolate cyclo-ligase [Myxococcales bacterium]